MVTFISRLPSTVVKIDKNRGGHSTAFTLIEMLICLIVVGSLLAIAGFAYMRTQEHMMDKVTAVNIRQWSASVGGQRMGSPFTYLEENYAEDVTTAINDFHKLDHPGEILTSPGASSEQPWQIAVRYVSVSFSTSSDVLLSSALRAPSTRHCARSISNSWGQVLYTEFVTIDQIVNITSPGQCVPIGALGLTELPPIYEPITVMNMVAVPNQSEPFELFTPSQPSYTPVDDPVQTSTTDPYLVTPATPADPTEAVEVPPVAPVIEAAVTSEAEENVSSSDNASPETTFIPIDVPLSPATCSVNVSQASRNPWIYMKISGSSSLSEGERVYLFTHRPNNTNHTFKGSALVAHDGSYLFDHVKDETVMPMNGTYSVTISPTSDEADGCASGSYTFTTRH